MEQKREPMNKNRIGGIRRWASGQLTAKPISIKVAGCRSGGCARKAVELTSGDLLCVADLRLKTPQGVLIASQKSAEGIVVLQTKARTVISALTGPSHGTAVCGPACTVVWEGRSREASPYPDHLHFKLDPYTFSSS